MRAGGGRRLSVAWRIGRTPLRWCPPTRQASPGNPDNGGRLLRLSAGAAESGRSPRGRFAPRGRRSRGQCFTRLQRSQFRGEVPSGPTALRTGDAVDAEVIQLGTVVRGEEQAATATLHGETGVGGHIQPASMPAAAGCAARGMAAERRFGAKSYQVAAAGKMAPGSFPYRKPWERTYIMGKT